MSPEAEVDLGLGDALGGAADVAEFHLRASASGAASTEIALADLSTMASDAEAPAVHRIFDVDALSGIVTAFLNVPALAALMNTAPGLITEGVIDGRLQPPSEFERMFTLEALTHSGLFATVGILSSLRETTNFERARAVSALLHARALTRTRHRREHGSRACRCRRRARSGHTVWATALLTGLWRIHRG